MVREVSLKNLNHVQLDRNFQRKLKEKVCERLIRAAYIKAEQVKAEGEGLAKGMRLPLTDHERDVVAEEMRWELEKRGFFNDAQG